MTDLAQLIGRSDVAVVQKLADAFHVEEHWRTRDVYPFERHQQASRHRVAVLSEVIAVAKSFPPSPQCLRALQAQQETSEDE